MKYLIKRNDFLRGAKRLDEKSEFLRDAKISGNRLYQDLIKEAGNSGPMENDIGWNDSLVGRFINHLIRKAKVANNLRKIKGVIKSLEGEFDRIAAEGFAYKLDDEQKKLYQKTILYSFFFELKEAVKNGSEVTIIINLTNNAILNINAIKDDMLDDRTKELMTRELEMFLSFLEQFKEEETEEEETEEEDGEEEDGEEEDETEEEDGEEAGAGAPVSVNMRTMINNLNALHNILKVYKSVNIAAPKQKTAMPANYVTKDGETIESIQKNFNINKNKLTSAEIIAKNANEPKLKAEFAKKPNIAKEKVPLPGNLSLVLESVYAVNESSNPKERHLSEAFAKLKKDIDALVDTKDAKLPITQEFIRILLAKHKNPKNDKLIVALYDNINKYLVGDKKQTIQEKDPLYKESYEYLMPKNEKNPNGGKIEVVAEKIARFSKRALQFDGKGLYDGLKELGVPLKNYVETLKVLMKNPITNVKPEYSEQSEEKKKESKYNVGQKYTYTNSKGVKKVVTLVSKTHKMKRGADKKWGTKDDIQMEPRDSKGRYIDVATDKLNVSFQASHSQLSPYVDQKGRETKYKKEEFIKKIENATRLALELEKDNPKKAAKIQANIDKMKAELDKLNESVSESAYISRYMAIELGIDSIVRELNEALNKNGIRPAGRLLKFDRFMSYIKEADDADPDGEAGDPRSGMTTVEKIQDYFDKKCMTVKEFTMEKTEFDKVRTNFENIEKDKDAFVIDGYDPIIEILKLFNRAYKLYMTQYISKRTNFNPEGGIGVSTGAEYTSFGGGDNKGPYRNNKIFDAWESAVLDIMKDRKYQFIFDKNTKLRVGNEIREKKGALLRKFMTDMLAGENLYKSSGYGSDGKGGGSQAEFLEKYFGSPDDDTPLTPDKTGFENDVKTNGDLQSKINENAIKVKATVFTNATTPEGRKPANIPVKNTFLAIKGKDSNDKEVKRFFFISQIESNFVWMQYSKQFGYFEEYISKIKYNVAVQYSTGDLDVNWKMKTDATVYYTKVKIGEFEDLLLKRGTIKIGMFNKQQGKIEEETIKISEAYWITKEKDGNQIVFDAIQTGAEAGKDEEKRKQLNAAIEAKNGAPSVKYLIENRDATIKKAS